MSKINFLTQWNLFNKLCDGILPIKAQIVYYKLLKWSNYFGLGEPFQLTNRRIMVDCEMSREKSFIDARNLLKQRGFIDFKAGKKGSPSTYILLDLTKYTFNLQVNTEVYNEVNTEVQSEVKTEVNTEVNNGFLQLDNNKTKTKNKTKKEIYKESENGFDIFWEEYPKKKGRGAAEKAFEKAIKKTDINTLLDALKVQKTGSQWIRDNGQYIPYPATWLNQERWEDEPDFTPADSHAKPRYDPNARNDVQAGYQGAMEMLEGLIDE